MIKLTVLYPNTPDLKFDKEYYVNKHGQLLTDLLGDAIISSDVNMGIAGGTPDTPAPYVVIANMVLNLWSRLNILWRKCRKDYGRSSKFHECSATSSN
jgi:hypothetical protein